MARVPNSYILLAAVAAAVALGLGVITGHFSRSMPNGPCLGGGVPENIIKDIDPDLTRRMRAEISAQQLKDNLRFLTRMPHVGGLHGSHMLGDEIAEIWRKYGLDLVEEKTYDVLLSYPDEDNPNLIRLYQGSDKIYESAKNEEIPGEDNTGIIQPYNAYAPSGTITGDMIYVNYCTRDDFEKLNELDISVNGLVVICRYGDIFRGNKVTIAASYYATGVILFSDPKDYASEGVDKVYPDTWWLPPTGVQRGNVIAEPGDPLTPGYPATKSAYRLKEEDAVGLPTIPSHPIGYKDARHFLEALGGPDVPAEWQGGLNFTYKVGPLKPDLSMEMIVNNKNTRANTTNIIGYIMGSVEPDRYVIMGSHRDAWAYGALDPSSGTAAMLEVSRVLGQFKTEGWRPRRTIVFCSWGAEEFGLVGSSEWVEQYVKKLSERTVAYLNLDIAVQGNYSLSMHTLPILNRITYEAAKHVETPNKAGKSLYEEWLEAFPDPETSTKPQIHLVGAGSDHAPFFLFAGVPCIDFQYTFNPKLSQISGYSGYPVYHSGIETFKIYETFIDPDFKYMQAMTQYALEVLVHLSEEYVIPYDIVNYAEVIIKEQNNFVREYGTLIAEKDITLDDFKAAGEAFYAACKMFTSRMEQINKNNPLEVRSYNDAMMNVERAFLDPQGVPGRPLLRHVLFTPSLADGYAGSAFPGLTDALYQIEDDPDQEGRWDVFRRHLATVTFILESAAESLGEFHVI